MGRGPGWIQHQILTWMRFDTRAQWDDPTLCWTRVQGRTVQVAPHICDLKDIARRIARHETERLDRAQQRVRRAAFSRAVKALEAQVYIALYDYRLPIAHYEGNPDQFPYVDKEAEDSPYGEGFPYTVSLSMSDRDRDPHGPIRRFACLVDPEARARIQAWRERDKG